MAIGLKRCLDGSLNHLPIALCYDIKIKPLGFIVIDIMLPTVAGG